MSKNHNYEVDVIWIGNTGQGTSDYRSYNRNHEIRKDSKRPIYSSADPAFRGDKTKWNPEELFLGSISACHQLWYLHLCSVNSVVVESYEDKPNGTMVETVDGGGHFTEITLNPVIKVSANTDIQVAIELHEKAHQMCFLANSINFSIKCLPMVSH